MIRYYLGKDTQIDQLNRMESTEIYPYIYILLIFDKGIMDFQWGKKNLFTKCFLNNYKLNWIKWASITT